MNDLPLWSSTDEDGVERVRWVEMTSDPDLGEAVESVKGVFAACGWSQLAGD